MNFFYIYVGFTINSCFSLRCDKKCKEEFKQKFENISIAKDCVMGNQSSEIFGARDSHYTNENGIVFCFRKFKNNLKMSSTSRNFDDPRIFCANDPMTWYRGRKNVAFNGKSCRFWSDVRNNTGEFYDISGSSSSSYSMRRILPDEYENFCRNPDESSQGPWCFVEENQKAPCFLPCKKGSQKRALCLDKRGFPYLEKDYDMSDILDLTELLSMFDNVQLMFESRYLLPMEVERKSRKTCINYGIIAEHFGPYVTVLDAEAKKFVKSIGRKKLWQLCVPEPEITKKVIIEPSETSKLRDAIQEDELSIAGCSFWRRCFSACQDESIKCWNKNDYEYYGSETSSVGFEMCLTWTEATSEILEIVRISTDVFKDYNSSLSIYHLYHILLFEDPDQFYIKSRLFLNTDNFCMMFVHKTESQKKTMMQIIEKHEISKFMNSSVWITEFEKMFENGPGCFVKRNKTLSFQPCFAYCNQNSTEPILARNLCQNGNGYEICKAPQTGEYLSRGRYMVKRSHMIDLLPIYMFIFVLSLL